MASAINMSCISSIILVVLAIQPTNAAAGKVQKIIGGTPAALGEIPYQVEILKNDDFWCGGSLVAPTFVVTTVASCLDGIVKDELKVRAGHISHSNPGSTAQTKLVKNIKVHELWDVQTPARNDIAVLELSSAMQINKFVKTIAVPCQECPVGATVNQILLASGWGKTENGDPSPVLMKVNLKVVSQTKCNQMWEGLVKPGMICAGTNGNSTCGGDSGGPLATTSGVTTLVGATSLSARDCDTNGVNLPTVFTRVHKYSTWIDTNTA